MQIKGEYLWDYVRHTVTLKKRREEEKEKEIAKPVLSSYFEVTKTFTNCFCKKRSYKRLGPLYLLDIYLY